MKTILIVEDREDIAELIQINLEKAGFKTILASNGEKAIKILEDQPIDLIVLDLMLPRISGIDLLKKIKSETRWNAIPIIIESARSDESDVVQGLELGADDYVTKPFSQKVLLARIQKIFERKELKIDNRILIQQGKLTINRENQEVCLHGKPVHLTAIEFRLLELFVLNQDKVLSRKMIMEAVWKNETYVIDRAIDVHINSLRKKLNDEAMLIQTVRGTGYRFSTNQETL